MVVERGAEICCRKCFWKKVMVIVGGVEGFLYICSPKQIICSSRLIRETEFSFNYKVNFIVLIY